jgi:hypothetical protein
MEGQWQAESVNLNYVPGDDAAAFRDDEQGKRYMKK